MSIHEHIDGIQKLNASLGNVSIVLNKDHDQLYNRDLPDQHPIEAITGLEEELSGKYTLPDGGIPKDDLNGSVQESLGKADTALQEHQSLNNYYTKDQVDSAVNAKYTKPTSGIPKSDLASAVQTSLGLADSAVQPETGKGLFSGSYNDLSNKPTIPSIAEDIGYDFGTGYSNHTVGKGLETLTYNLEGLSSTVSRKYDKPSTGIPKSDLVAAVQTSLGLADSAIQTETDPTVPSWAKQTSKPTYTKAEVGLSNVDNTSDVNKPISTATQTALNAKANSTDMEAIQAKISSQASTTNKLVSASEMGDAISAVEAKQLYATNNQGSFATKAALLSTTTFYNADGTVATPTKNDVAYVLADESHDGKSAKYVIANDVVDDIVWGFVIKFSDATFTQAQMNAINSGVTSEKVSSYDSHIADSTIHVTTADKTGWSGKQDKITASGLLKGNGSGTISTAVAGTDYQAPITFSINPEGAYDRINSIPLGAKYDDSANEISRTYAKQYDLTVHTGNGNIHVTAEDKASWYGRYTKPSGGIPKIDLASAVQTSLGRADSALQSVPSTYRTASAQDTIDNGKENKGKITISGVEKTANTHTVTIVTNGVTSNFTLVGVS